MKKKYLGIRDISKIANVSVATVSRVLNTPEKVAPSTVKKVKKVIDEYGYVPNLQAKNMYSQCNNTIAFFVSDLNLEFFVKLIKSLNRICFQHKYTLLICNTENNPQLEVDYLKYCKGMRTKGIIFTEGSNENLRGFDLQEQNIVFHDRDMGEEFSSVTCDNEKGIGLLVDYLYNLDHRSFAFVGYKKEYSSVSIRMQSFLASLKKKGVEVKKEHIVECGWSSRDGADAFDYICTLKEKPTAIICANDAIARGVIFRMRKRGAKVPEDFSVTGFDGDAMEYFYPQLTTVVQNVDVIANELFLCATSDKKETRRIITDVEIVIGNSCKKYSEN